MLMVFHFFQYSMRPALIARKRLLILEIRNRGAPLSLDRAEGFGRQKDKTSLDVTFTSVLGNVTRTKRQFV